MWISLARWPHFALANLVFTPGLSVPIYIRKHCETKVQQVHAQTATSHMFPATVTRAPSMGRGNGGSHSKYWCAPWLSKVEVGMSFVARTWLRWLGASCMCQSTHQQGSCSFLKVPCCESCSNVFSSGSCVLWSYPRTIRQLQLPVSVKGQTLLCTASSS